MADHRWTVGRSPVWLALTPYIHAFIGTASRIPERAAPSSSSLRARLRRCSECRQGRTSKVPTPNLSPQPPDGRHAPMRMVHVTSLIRPHGVSRIGSQMRLSPWSFPLAAQEHEGNTRQDRGAIGRTEREETYRAMAGPPQGVRPAAARRSRRALAPSGQDAGGVGVQETREGKDTR